MAQYEPGDIATYYFIIVEDKGERRIQAWSGNKTLAKMYMDFHHCPRFRMQSVTKRIEEIYKIVEENLHDEIQVCNIIVKNHDKKKHDAPSKVIAVPATNTEITFINEETQTSLLSRVPYGYLNGAIPYLKKEWQAGLKSILLQDTIRRVVHQQNPRVLQDIEFDQLMILLKSFPDNFGT